MKKYRYWKSWYILPLLLILSLAVAACGADDNSTPTPPMDQTGILPGSTQATPLVDSTVDVGVLDMTATAEMDSMPTLDAMATETPMPQVIEPATVMTTGTPDAMHEDRVALVRSADIIGLNIINAADDVIARIEDVLFDDEGEIHYVVLNIMHDTAQADVAQGYPYYGIEWDDFNISYGDDFTETGTQRGTGAQPSSQTRTQTGFQIGVLLYQEDTINLNNAVGIQDEWLEADHIFYRTSIDNNVDIDNDADMQPHMLDGLYRLSAFTQFRLFNPNLVNPSMDDLGVVEDMIVNVDEGKVQYVVAEVGGWLGIGRTTVIIPWERVGYDEVEEYFVIDATEEELENAPMLELDSLDDWGMDSNWERDIDAYWGSVSRR